MGYEYDEISFCTLANYYTDTPQNQKYIGGIKEVVKEIIIKEVQIIKEPMYENFIYPMIIV